MSLGLSLQERVSQGLRKSATATRRTERRVRAGIGLGEMRIKRSPQQQQPVEWQGATVQQDEDGDDVAGFAGGGAWWCCCFSVGRGGSREEKEETTPGDAAQEKTSRSPCVCVCGPEWAMRGRRVPGSKQPSGFPFFSRARAHPPGGGGSSLSPEVRGSAAPRSRHLTSALGTCLCPPAVRYGGRGLSCFERDDPVLAYTLGRGLIGRPPMVPGTAQVRSRDSRRGTVSGVARCQGTRCALK